MTHDSIDVEYNQDLQPLEELLCGVERAGDFFVSGTVEMPMPKVEVEGVGVLSFPVPSTQIAALVQHATRAPYGRGQYTILDESVRKVWQLPPSKLRLGGKSWAANFDGILKQVIAGLACDGMAVSAELYKLLVYDTGSFFLAHRDTEKADGMFGTLVVVLPSAHRGGESAGCGPAGIRPGGGTRPGGLRAPGRLPGVRRGRRAHRGGARLSRRGARRGRRRPGAGTAQADPALGRATHEERAGRPDVPWFGEPLDVPDGQKVTAVEVIGMDTEPIASGNRTRPPLRPAATEYQPR